MKKRLTDSQFKAAVVGLNVGQQTLDIAYGVLVEGRPQAEFVAQLGITKGAVWQAVKRVWDVHEEKQRAPSGYERVTAVLPEHQAFIVKKWAEDARKKQEKAHENIGHRESERGRG
ncbi:TrfB-related DNA-binding protein [Hahella ganghwensis]|uniref:TrfB-related DNA-binding protein n=1 Tax=Hahella ganghwensis TaxID=286420 RepID=UPI000375BBFB|nr:TrfB-related DNA-binding protein [Hahella ganghwensis]